MSARIRMLLNLSKMDFRKRYLGTFLGAIWALLMPMVTIVLIYFVMTHGLKAGMVGDVAFVNWLIPGMLGWFYISDVLASGVYLITEYSYLVTKLQFPVRLLIPMRQLSSLPVHLFLLAVCMLMLLPEKNIARVYWLQLPYYIACSCVLCMGINFLTSALQVFVKDIGNLVGVALQILFWTTPLFWNADLIAGGKFSFLLYSPFAYIVTGYRDCLIFGVGFWQRPQAALVFWGIAFLCYAFGALVFKRTRPHFADVL